MPTTPRALEIKPREPGKGVPALPAHGVVRVVPVVEARAELGVGEDLVGFVDGGHFGFGAAFVGVGEFGLFAARLEKK